ncbi:MAG: GntR family transcriptional regulator [Gammaproteobacteria bacterium]|nr:GntR family transcriptional regulator [Gammaproteobacteria bacterium]
MGKHEEIADSLTQDILVGQYRLGERLPSERDLATRFDANRGAVREAMKKLEQLGIADIQPGGARVAPLQEASLDVIGHMLAVGELPDRKLVDQILEVMDALMRVAVESALAEASDDTIETLRSFVNPLFNEDLAHKAHMEAQVALMGAIMRASDNLVCQLIARSVLLQFGPRMAPLQQYSQLDTKAHATYARQLDLALASRDLEAIRAVFVAFAKLHHDSVMRAYAAYELARTGAAQEVAAS